MIIEIKFLVRFLIYANDFYQVYKRGIANFGFNLISALSFPIDFSICFKSFEPSDDPQICSKKEPIRQNMNSRKNILNLISLDNVLYLAI